MKKGNACSQASNFKNHAAMQQYLWENLILQAKINTPY